METISNFVDRSQMKLNELDADMKAHAMKLIKESFYYNRFLLINWEALNNYTLQQLSAFIESDRYNYNDWEAPRRCKVCEEGMWSGHCFPEVGEYYCSEECLYQEVTPEQYTAYFEEGTGYYMEWEDDE